MGGKWPGGAKNGGFCCGFSRKGAKLVGLLFSNRASFEGRRDGNEGQGAGVVQIGVDGGGNVGNEDMIRVRLGGPYLTAPPQSGAPSSARSYRD